MKPLEVSTLATKEKTQLGPCIFLFKCGVFSIYTVRLFFQFNWPCPSLSSTVFLDLDR